MSKKGNKYAKGKTLKRRFELASPPEVCERITDLYLLAVLGIFPLIVGTGDYGYGNLVEAKAWTWIALTALWAAALIGYLIRCRIRHIPFSVRFGPAQWTAVILTGICIASALLSEHTRESFLLIHASNTNSVLFTVSYAAAFLGVSLFGRLTGKHIRALGISVFLGGVLSAVQLTGRNPLTLYPEGMSYYNKYKEYAGAFLGTMGNIDCLAAFLCFAVPVLTVYALRAATAAETNGRTKRPDARGAVPGTASGGAHPASGSRRPAPRSLSGILRGIPPAKRNLLLLLPALLSLYILYAVDVDAAKVGLLGCLIVVPPVVIRNKRAAKYAAAVCAAALLLGVTAVYFWPGDSGFLYEASRMLHGQIEPSFGHDRMEIWMKALPYVRQHPILGNGPASGAWLFLDIRKVNEAMERVTTVYNAHNVYLGWLLETGIPGLGCVLPLLGKGAAGWIRSRENDVLAALGAGIACYLIQDFFNLGLVVTAPFLWIGLGILAGQAASRKDAAGSAG